MYNIIGIIGLIAELITIITGIIAIKKECMASKLRKILFILFVCALLIISCVFLGMDSGTSEPEPDTYVYNSNIVNNYNISLEDDIAPIEDETVSESTDNNDAFVADYTIEAQVRLADSEDKTWYKAVEAQVGDKLELLIGYYNTSGFTQTDVAIRDYLPKNLRYIDGTTILYNSNHVSGVTMNSNAIADGGVGIGSYGKGANAYIVFTAEVVDNSLVSGENVLVNNAQGGVGDTMVEDHAIIHITYEGEN